MEFPKIIGVIEPCHSLTHLNIYVHKLVSLTTALQRPINTEDLYQLLCFHSILFEEISFNNSCEAKAILAHTTQVCGSCLMLIREYQVDNNPKQYINSKLINTIKYNQIVNSLKFITSDAIKPVLDSWYKELKTFLYYYLGEEYYNDIKSLGTAVMLLAPTTEIKEEQIDLKINSLFLTIDHLTPETQIDGEINIIG